MTTLSDIQFPVYRLGVEKPQEEDGVVFYHRIYADDTEKKLIVDNKNWHHTTLAQRRLKIMMSPDHPELFKIRDCVFFIADLIKLATPKTWFIDSVGTVFNYTKSKSVSLVFEEINNIIPLSTGGAIIEVKGIQTRFKCLYAPQNEKFAGLLKVGLGYILYGLYDEKPEDTRRMI